MANLTNTQANLLVKETLDPMIQESFAFNCKTLNLFKKEVKTEDVTNLGRKFRIKVKSNQSFASQASEGGAFPATGRYLHVEANVGYRSQFSSFGFTGDVEDLATSNTLMNTVKLEVKDTTESFDEKMNFFLFGDGSGILAVIDSVSTNDITCLNTVANSYGARAIMADQVLNAYDQSGAAYRSGDMNVVSVARSTDIVSVDAAAGSIANDDDDVLVFKGSYGFATQGLKYHIADTGMWLGLSRTTYPSLKATVHDAASASLDWDMLDIAVLKAANVRGDGAPTDDYRLILHPCQITYLKAAARNSANVQFNAQAAGQGKVDLGIDTITMNGMKLHADSWCAPSDVWGVRLQDWAFEEVAPRQLYKHNDGNVFIQQISGGNYVDAKEGRVYSRSNLVCKAPWNQFRIKNVNFSTSDTRIQRQ